VAEGDGGRQLRIEPLSAAMERSGFCCGIDALDDYFSRRAGQDAKRRVAVPYALVGQTGVVLGYYTLSQLAVRLSDLPTGMARRLPRYPLLPATLLGRLAVDRRHQGDGLGRLLLMDALRRSYTASLQVASLAVVTEAKDERSLSFYEAHDFRPLPSRQRTLFLPMGTIARLFEDQRDQAPC
jgi:GNAT superfamily N-acetyltransferase